MIDNSVLITTKSDVPSALISSVFSNKLKSKILSPVNADGVSKGFKINPQSKRSPSKITSKTLKKVVMPKAILRILKDIEDHDIFSKILYHTEQWRSQEIDEDKLLSLNKWATYLSIIHYLFNFFNSSISK